VFNWEGLGIEGVAQYDTHVLVNCLWGTRREPLDEVVESCVGGGHLGVSAIALRLVLTPSGVKGC
jgi:hypothetical protein